MLTINGTRFMIVAGYGKGYVSVAPTYPLPFSLGRIQQGRFAEKFPLYLLDFEDGLDLDSNLVRESLQANRRASMDTLIAEHFKVEL